MIARLGPDPRRFLALALGWHLLWAALLLPYAVVLALILGGQQAAQDLVDSLAHDFFVPVLFVAASLVPNVLVAALSNRLLAGTGAAGQLATSAVIFGLAWLIAIQALLPVTDPAGGLSVNPIAIWAALAGAIYGLVVPLFEG
jgi:hypothetical protein